MYRFIIDNTEAVDVSSAAEVRIEDPSKRALLDAIMADPTSYIKDDFLSDSGFLDAFPYTAEEHPEFATWLLSYVQKNHRIVTPENLATFKAHFRKYPPKALWTPEFVSSFSDLIDFLIKPAPLYEATYPFTEEGYEALYKALYEALYKATYPFTEYVCEALAEILSVGSVPERSASSLFARQLYRHEGCTFSATRVRVRLIKICEQIAIDARKHMAELRASNCPER
jgi:hypothetical protein